MGIRHLRRRAGLIAGAAATALVLAACADDGGDGDSGDGGEGGDITIGVFEGWEEGIAASYLWAHVLEDAGYSPTLEWGDPVVVYAGVAQGQFDVSFDAWLPATHEDYWAEHGDNMEDLGTWFDDAPLTIAVNEDAPIQSLDELADNADQFGNQLVGIEPGAGLTRITEENVVPTYGLEGMDFVPSSTAAMLAELERATSAGENVAVTLWRPHWAYDAFPIRDLEDPENALGDPEEIHSFATTGFSEEFPEVAEWVTNFWLTDEELQSLENIMFNENEAASEDEYEKWVKSSYLWLTYENSTDDTKAERERSLWGAWKKSFRPKEPIARMRPRRTEVTGSNR
jgi:glycine betaine/proline transport system substrate-binding protein